MRPPRILAPSIVDPSLHRGGAGTAIRGLVGLLEDRPLGAQVKTLAPAPPVRRRAKQLTSLLRSAVSLLPAKAIFARQKRFRDDVRQSLERERFDALLLNGADLLWLVDAVPSDLPIIVYTFNREADLYRAQIDAHPLALGPLRILLRRDADKLDRWEESGMRRANASIFVSTLDEANAPKTQAARTLHLPPVFDGTESPRARIPTPGGVLHLGFLANFEWWPNRHGLDWLVNRVLPHIRSAVRVHLFGHRSETITPADPRIFAHGYAEDLGTVWDTCDAMICPVSVGAGVSVKVAESLYRGMPMLARPFGLRGLGVPSDPAIVLLDEAADWAAFLDSPDRLTLARRSPAPDVRRRFAPATYRGAVHQLISDTLR